MDNLTQDLHKRRGTRLRRRLAESVGRRTKMTTIPENVKNALKNGTVLQLSSPSEKIIGTDLMDIVKLAVMNKLSDGKSYTFQINFNNGKIVGSKEHTRLSVEELDGRASTGRYILPEEGGGQTYEYNILYADNIGKIDNEGRWVARVTKKENTVFKVMVNPDFNDLEDRNLIETFIKKGLKTQRPM
nr:MAG TPA: hypothetical protein [Caudoviricetes sp.]